MQCPRCQHEHSADAAFCQECGARLEAACPSCGTPNQRRARFCKACGQRLGRPEPAPGGPDPRFGSPERYTPRHLAEKILTSRSALEGERKQVTVLFADLKGSMELLADRDPEEARALLDPVLERMMEAVHRYEGTVNQVMGDGIMALFGAPIAHEDHAVRACYAALDMLAAIRRYADEARRTHGITVQIRVGLNSGEVVVRAIGSDVHMDYTAVGQTTHLAARMEQLAGADRILLTASTLRLAEGYVAVRPLGPVPVKGLEAPIEVYEAQGAGPVRSRLHAAAARGLTRFVGRETELEQLRRALDRAGAGQGQVVAVMGEPGVGKSRLVWEACHSHRTHGWRILQSGSVSYGKATSSLPVVDLVKAYFGIEDRDDPRSVREKLVGRLLTLDEALKQTLPAFRALLDLPVEDGEWAELDPPERRRRTLDALKRLLLRESQVQPLIVVVEDLHWVDSETQALLDHLVDGLPAARLLLLVNYRPGYQHAWGHKTYYTQLRLDPLPPGSAEELLDALLGRRRELQPLKELLIARTEGNPFFLEESVRALVESRVLSGASGELRMEKPVTGIQVPATVQAILSARIDRLPPGEKGLLQTASVIGKDVPFAILRALADRPDDELRQALAHLQAAEFLYETSLFPDLEYTFKHALTHEVAYGSLLQERRRALHAGVVEAIEGLYPDRLAEHVEHLAHHALAGELWEKAVAYFRLAGAKAVARSANREAVGFFERALDVLARHQPGPASPADVLDIRIAMGPAVIAIKGASAPDVEALYTEARALGEETGDLPRLFPALWGLWYANYARGQYPAAREIGERLLAVARESGDRALLLEAHHAVWATLAGMGDAGAALRHAQQGLVLYDRQQHRTLAFVFGGHDPGVCCRNFSGLALWQLGYPERAVERLREGLDMARELGHPLTSVIAFYMAAWVYYQRGETSKAVEHAEAVRSQGIPQEFASWPEDAAVLLACLATTEDGGEDGIDRLHGRLTPARAAGATWRDVFCLCLLAEAYGRLGRPEKGLRVLGGITNTEAFYAAELHRIRGELLVRQAPGRPDEAEASFRQAVAIARARQEKSLELRALTSLGRVLACQGKRDEARQALADCYGWFTEGFETRDLMEARALLGGP